MNVMNNQLPYYFRMFVALGYIVIGVIALTTNAGEMMTGSKAFGMAFAFGCIAYGLFRAYRNQKKWDKPTHEE
jgi:hypothetical protein